MKNFKFFPFILLLVFFTTKVHSQGIMSVHFGPSFPVSDFGSDNIFDEDAGGAAVGFNIGLKYTYPLNDKGLGLFGGIDFNYDGLKKDFKDDVEDLVESL